MEIVDRPVEPDYSTAEEDGEEEEEDIAEVDWGRSPQDHWGADRTFVVIRKRKKGRGGG